LLQVFLLRHQFSDNFHRLCLRCPALGGDDGVAHHSHDVLILDASDVDAELVDYLPPDLPGKRGWLYLVVGIGEDELEDLHDFEIVHLRQQEGEVLETERLNELHNGLGE
jgi:hypothetical protein